MVRETRYLWVGNIPEKISEDDLTQHFQRYGKIQSVKFVVEDGGRAAVVAFMDIKSASKAHGAENKIDGKSVETQYSEASGKGTRVTRTSFDTEPSARSNPQPPSRYDSTKPGYDGYNYGGYYTGSGPGRSEDSNERWQQQESGGGDYYAQDRGRPRQRYQQSQEYYKQKSYEGHYPGAYEKYGGIAGSSNPSRPPRSGQSPGNPEIAGSVQRSVKQPPKSYQHSRSRSRSRSSSTSSSGSHSTSTSRSRRSSSKASKERKRGSVIVQPHKKNHGGEENRSSGGKLGLLLRGFPPRSSDTSIRDGLFHEYKKCGKVMSVSITGEKEDRYAIVTFKKTEDAAKGLEQARSRVFFGRKVDAEPHDGVDDSLADYRPPEAELDEYHHKATRTLFVGNLQLDISKEQLKDIFRRYGLILDIDIKNQQPNQVFAFVQYDNIKSVVQALHEMDGETVGSSKVKLGFGRSMPTNVLWVDNITEQVQESYLKRQFCRAAPVNYVLIDRDTGRALVFYDSNELAVMSLSAMRGRAIASKKIQIDFASTACMNALMDNMEATGQLRPEDRPDQKGFRQYPQPTHPTDATYEERQGYDRSGKPYYYDKGYRGRGSFRGQGYSRGRAYYQTYDDSYKQKRYDDNYEADPSKYGGEDFERDLQDYKERTYKSKEGTDAGEGSPHVRSSERYDDYSGKEDFFDGRASERYKDADSQSGDRESMRSYHSDSKRDKYEKYSEDKYSKDKVSDDKRKDKMRGYSPNSDFNFRNVQRSPSRSPLRGRKLSKDTRARSPSSPSRMSSPEVSSPKKGLKAKIDAKNEPGTYTPSTTLISEIQRTRPRKHPLKRESESDLSELDRALLKTGLFESPPKKRQAIEEHIERARREAEANIELRQKMEREHTLRRSVSGSHSMDYSGPTLDNYREVRTKGNSYSVHLDNRIIQSGYGEGEIESKFSTPSPSTKSTKSESDKTPDSSERHSGSHSSGDMDILEKEKQRLLSELQDMDDNGSVSDGEIRDEEDDPKIKEKKPKLEEVFDLDWSPSESNMKKWREKAKKLEREKQCPEGQENKEPHPKNAHTEPPPKPPEPPGTGDGTKFKPIDAKKSFRKQMEAMRKEHDKDTASLTSQDSKNGEGPRESSKITQGPEMDTEESALDTSIDKMKPSASEFKRKKISGNSNDFPKVKGQRSYRTTRTDEMLFGLSSGDEHDITMKDKYDESIQRDTSKPRQTSDVDKVGKSPSANRRESTDSKHSCSHDPERDSSTRSRHGSKDSRESSTSRRDSQARRDRSGDSSSKKGVRDLRSEPCIIPEAILETKSKDGKYEKRILQDPRKRPENRKSSPLSFPLPKFASKFLKKGTSPKQASKPRSSPKGQQEPLASNSKLTSPLFSPDISPVVSQSKTNRQSRKDNFEKSQEKDKSCKVKTEDLNKETSDIKDDTNMFDDIKTAVLDNIKFEKVDKTIKDSGLCDSIEKNDNRETNVTMEVSEQMDKHKLKKDNNSCMDIDQSISAINKERLPEYISLTEDGKKLTDLNLDSDKSQIIDRMTLTSENLDTEKETQKNEKMDTRTSSKLETMDTSEAEVSCDNFVPNLTTEKISTISATHSADRSVDIKLETNNKVKTDGDNSSCQVVSLKDAAIKGVTVDKNADPKETIDKNEDKLSMKDENRDSSKKDMTDTPSKSETTASPKDKHTSDSDMSDLDNSGVLQSLDEQIRALDERLEQASSHSARRTPTDSPSTPSTPTVVPAPYRERFRVRKRGDSASSLSSGVSCSTPAATDSKGEPSDYVKSLLSRSSIFDQDSKRLEQIDEKYQPKEYNLNLDRPTVNVGMNSDQEDDDCSFESRVKEYYGLSQPKPPTFPSAIFRPQIGSGLSIDGETSNNENDGFGLGPPLTLAPPGSLANQDLTNKFGPQTLSRYPFLAKKSNFEFTKNSPPQPGTPIAIGISDPLRSPTMLPRDPRRDPLSPPLVMPPSILKKSPVTPPVNTSPGVSSVSPLLGLTSPPGILRKTEPGPSILKKVETPHMTSKLMKVENFDLVSEESSKLDVSKKDNNVSGQVAKNEDFPDSNIELYPKLETKETKKSKEGSQPFIDKHTPSGTGNTAVSSQHIEPENSAVPKNELSSGDGVQYQSTPSPPVLIKESKSTQGIGTKTSIKRTASEAFDDKSDKDIYDGSSPPQLTESVTNPYRKCEELRIETKATGSKCNEPDSKKSKVFSDAKKDKKAASSSANNSKATTKDVKKSSGSSSLKSSSKSNDRKIDNVKKSSCDIDKKIAEKRPTEKSSSNVKASTNVKKSSENITSVEKLVHDNINSTGDKKMSKSTDKSGNEKKSPISSGKTHSGSERNSSSKSHDKGSSGLEKKTTDKSSNLTDKKSVDRFSKATDFSNGTDKKLPENSKVSNNGEKVEKRACEKKGNNIEKGTEKKVSDKKSILSDKKSSNGDKKLEKSTVSIPDKKGQEGKQTSSIEKKAEKNDSDKKYSHNSEKKIGDKSNNDKSKKTVENKMKDVSKSNEKSRHHSSTSSVTSTKSNSSITSNGSRINDAKKDVTSACVSNSKYVENKKDSKRDKMLKDTGKVQKPEELNIKGDKKQSPSQNDNKYKSKNMDEHVSKNGSKITLDGKSKEQKLGSSTVSKFKEKLKSPDKVSKVEDKKSDVNRMEKASLKDTSKIDKNTKFTEKEKGDKSSCKSENNDIIGNKTDKSEKSEIKADKYCSKVDKNNQKNDKHKEYNKSKDKQPNIIKEKGRDYSVDKHHKSEKHKSDSKVRPKGSHDKTQKRDDVKKVKHNVDKKENKNSKINDVITEKKRSPGERKSRSDSMTGETRELKQLRESLGIDADGLLNGEPIQFFSMYDRVKGRTHKEVSKEESRKEDKLQNQLKSPGRRSHKLSGSDEESLQSEDDSAFSSENKENKKNVSKHKGSNRKYIITSTSDEFSSDDSDESLATDANKRMPKQHQSKKSSPKSPIPKKKSYVSSSTAESSDSSADSSDVEKVCVKKKPSPPQKIINKKKIVKSIESNLSSSSGSDSDIQPKLVSSKKSSQNKFALKSKLDEAKKKTPIKRPIRKAVTSSSSSSSSSSDSSDESDSDSNMHPVKTDKKKKTALEKLESIFSNSGSDTSSSDGIVSPVKVDKKLSPPNKKKSTGFFSDSDDISTSKSKNKQIKATKNNKLRKLISSSSESSGSSSQSESESDSDTTTKKNIKHVPKTDKKLTNEGSTKVNSRKDISANKEKKIVGKISEKKSQDLVSEKRAKANSPVRKQSPKETNKTSSKQKSIKLKEEQNNKITKIEKSPEKPLPEEATNKRNVSEVNIEPTKIDKSQCKSYDVTGPIDTVKLCETKMVEEKENTSDITEEEKGREEKANKMQSIFFKHTDNIFEKMELSNEVSPATQSSSEAEDRDHESKCNVVEEVKSKLVNQLPVTHEATTCVQNENNKLFDTSDSESEVDVKLQITEKILQQDESQDSEIIPSTPDFEDSQDVVQGNKSESDNLNYNQDSLDEIGKEELKQTDSQQKPGKQSKKSNSPTSEPVKNTVVETEKAVKSLEKDWYEAPAHTIVETGIVANIEIQSETVEEKVCDESKADMVAEDEVASAILSICCVPGPSENNTVSVVSSSELAASLNAEANNEGSQVVYEIDDQSETQQAVAALVFGDEESYSDTNKENSTYTVTYAESEVLVPAEAEEEPSPNIIHQAFPQENAIDENVSTGCVFEEAENREKNEQGINLELTITEDALVKPLTSINIDPKNQMTEQFSNDQDLETEKNLSEVSKHSEPSLTTYDEPQKCTDKVSVDLDVSNNVDLKFDNTGYVVKSIEHKDSFDIDAYIGKPHEDIDEMKSEPNSLENKSLTITAVVDKPTNEQDKTKDFTKEEMPFTGVSLDPPKEINKSKETSLKQVNISKPYSEPKEVKPSKYISELLANPIRIQEMIDANKPKSVIKHAVEEVVPQIPSFERLSSLQSKSEPMLLSNPLASTQPYYTERKDEFPCYVTPSFNLLPKDNLQRQTVPAPTSVIKPVEHTIKSIVNPQALETGYSTKCHHLGNNVQNMKSPKEDMIIYDTLKLAPNKIVQKPQVTDQVENSRTKPPTSDYSVFSMVNNTNYQNSSDITSDQPLSIPNFDHSIKRNPSHANFDVQPKSSIQNIENLIQSVDNKIKNSDVPNPIETFRKIEALKEQLVPKMLEHNNRLDDSINEKPDSITASKDFSKASSNEREDPSDNLDFLNKNKAELKTYESRNTYNMFNSPEVDDAYVSTPIQESDTDKEKDEEEQKDNIVYEKEPEKETISLEGLNEFEDEEDLPDLIIDESPHDPKNSVDEDEEIEELSSTNKDMAINVETHTNMTPSENVKLQENTTELGDMNSNMSEKQIIKQKENIPEMTTKSEFTEVSLKVDEELEGGVLHIVECHNQPQPTITLTPSKIAPLPITPKSKRKSKNFRKPKKITSPAMENSDVKAISSNEIVQNLTTKAANARSSLISTDSDIRSPVTRRKAKQEDTTMAGSNVISPPTTRHRSGNQEPGEKFSSRGRKIIPKERGDEVTTMTRKGRRNLSVTSNNGDERITKKVDENAEINAEQSESGGKKKTWPLRNRKESDTPEVENKEEKLSESIISEAISDQPSEPPKECGPIKIKLRRTPRGRKATIQKTTTGEVPTNTDVLYTNVTESDSQPVLTAIATPTDTASVQGPTEDSVRTRRSRRMPKGKKPMDTTSPVTRTRKSDGSVSPRSKSAEATSPKELAKSYVKLEKLNIEKSAIKKEDDDQKDLYEWNDDEEKPLPEYKVARAARKRKSNDVSSNSESPQKPEVEVEQKRTKKSKAAAELKKEAKEQKKDTKEVKVLEKIPEPIKIVPPKPEPVPEKKDPPPEPRKPDMNDILQGQRGHLPLKLAMKWESQEAARKEREAKEAAEKAAAEKAAHEAQKLVEEKNKPGTVSEHLDKVIDEVARGNFEKSEEARIIDKKRGRFNREEQFSPGVKDLSMRPGTVSQPTVTSVATTSTGVLPVLNTQISSQAHCQAPTTLSRPPSVSSIQTGVVTSRAFGLAPNDGTHGQSIMRVPNPHMGSSHIDTITSGNDTFVRPNIQPSSAKISPQQKTATKTDATPHMPITVAVPPIIAAAQASLSSPQQLSPHSVPGANPRMPVPQAIASFAHQYQHPSMPPSQISPTPSQASELRAALAQPSKLMQQEQRLQQQRLHGQPQLSPHLPDPKQSSPTMTSIGPHRMPFPIPEQRTTTRAEPKSQGPITPAHLSGHDGSRPDSTGVFPGHPELTLAHPDLRNGLPPGQMLIPGLTVPHMVPYLPRMPVDPRVLQQFHEHEQRIAVQQQMLGMLPPHHPQAAAMVNQHQPPVADRHPHDQASTGGRPPSRHPTPPTAQPSPRGTPHHHSPQVSTPLTPQLPQPPIAALPNRAPPIAHMSNGIQHGIPPDGMIVAVQQYPIVWQGYLYLKNDASNVQMHFVTGNRSLVSGALDGTTDGGIVRIAQRMRLEPTQLEGVAKRMQKDDEFSMLVAVPHGKDQLDFVHQTSKLQAGFIQYLQQKQAAGIVNIPNPIQPGYVVHIFPPCEFSSRNITQKAPELTRCLGDMSYLVVVITST